jgi:hypothetical protein
MACTRDAVWGGIREVIAPLTRDEVVSVIEGRSVASRAPVFIHFWVREDTFGDRAGKVAQILRRYVPDMQHLPL